MFKGVGCSELQGSKKSVKNYHPWSTSKSRIWKSRNT